jgi:hypothetical protein
MEHRPGHDRGKGILPAQLGHRRVDVLGLAALAVRGDHHAPGDDVRHFGAVVEADQVEAEIDASRRPGRRVDPVAADVEDRRVQLHAREPRAEDVGVHPVRRGSASVEQAGLGQRERAGAERRDPSAPAMGGAQRGQHRVGCRVLPRRLGRGRDDHGVCPSQRFEAVRHHHGGTDVGVQR